MTDYRTVVKKGFIFMANKYICLIKHLKCKTKLTLSTIESPRGASLSLFYSLLDHDL